MQNSLFRIENISKRFEIGTGGGELEVVRDISMDIQEKEVVVILGPSGCGKSTFLKVLGGIMSASSGEMTLNGQACGQQIPQKALKDFGFVFQSNNLLQWRTAEANLRFMLEMLGLKGEPWDQRVDQMLEIVGLQNYKKVYPHELSGGMKQRVGIARALVHDPKILIMDQPLGALDAITRRMLAYEILNIWKKTQKTIVMVTNNVDEAILLANRIFVFSHMPAVIKHEILVDIPIEARNENFTHDKRFNELRNQVNEIVRSNMQEGGES